MFEEPAFASITTVVGPPKILVRPTSESQVGQHDMVFKVSLPERGIIHFEPFVIDITRCSIHTLTVEQPDRTSFTYFITDTDGPLFIPFPQYEYQPQDCPGGMFNGLNFALEPEFSWATIQGQTIKIEESDTSNEGNYEITWSVCPAMDSAVDCAEVTYQIKLAACKYDIISTTVPIRSFEYTMGSPLSVGPNMQQRFEECSVLYSLN